MDDLTDHLLPFRRPAGDYAEEHRPLSPGITGVSFGTCVCHMAFFQDPDGNALMLHHRYAPQVTEPS